MNYTIDKEAEQEIGGGEAPVNLKWWAAWFSRYLEHFGLAAHVGPIHGAALAAQIGAAVVTLTPDMGGMLWAVRSLFDSKYGAPTFSPSGAAGEVARLLGKGST